MCTCKNKKKIESVKNDIIDFCDKELFYDYGRVCADLIIENKDEIYEFIKKLNKLENK